MPLRHSTDVHIHVPVVQLLAILEHNSDGYKQLARMSVYEAFAQFLQQSLGHLHLSPHLHWSPAHPEHMQGQQPVLQSVVHLHSDPQQQLAVAGRGGDKEREERRERGQGGKKRQGESE